MKYTAAKRIWESLNVEVTKSAFPKDKPSDSPLETRGMFHWDLKETGMFPGPRFMERNPFIVPLGVFENGKVFDWDTTRKLGVVISGAGFGAMGYAVSQHVQHFSNKWEIFKVSSLLGNNLGFRELDDDESKAVNTLLKSLNNPKVPLGNNKKKTLYCFSDYMVDLMNDSSHTSGIEKENIELLTLLLNTTPGEEKNFNIVYTTTSEQMDQLSIFGNCIHANLRLKFGKDLGFGVDDDNKMFRVFTPIQRTNKKPFFSLADGPMYKPETEHGYVDQSEWYLNEIDKPTPYQICKSYANSFIARAELVDALVNYDYVSNSGTDGYDSILVDRSGSWAEVSTAVQQGVIGEDVYEEVFNLRHNVSQ